MPLFLSMTLCGISGTLFYIALEPLAEKYLSVRWRRVYLILNILMYLVPFSCFHARYRKLFYKLSADKFFHKFIAARRYINVTAGYIQIAPGRIYIPHLALYILILAVVITGTALSGRQVHKYNRLKKFLDDVSDDITGLEYGKICKNIPKNVRIYLCGDMDTPFAVGVIRPVIVLPGLNWSELELSFIIEHEVTHIRQCDNWVKILSLAVFALNFYNPMGYYLVNQWNEVAELSCDSKVIAGRSKEEARMYGNLIIDIAQMQADSEKFPIMGLNSQEKLMRKRIYGIKRGAKRVSAINKFLGACVMCVTLLVSSFPVLAYMPKDIMRGDYIYDEVIFTEGNVASYEDSDEPVAYLSCGHDYAVGELTKYKKFSDGSCLREYYKARRCKWCLDIDIGTQIRTDTWEICPHSSID